MVFTWYDNGIRIQPERTTDPYPKETAPVSPIKETSERALNKTDEDDSSGEFDKGAARHAYEKAQGLEQPLTKVVYAEQIMSKNVETLLPSTPIPEAMRKVRQRRFRHFPIVDEKGKLMGIVSDRSLLAHLVDQKTETWEETWDLNNTPVSSILSRKVLTARPNASIREIAKILFDEHIGAMPILDDDENLVGMITRSDILRAIIHYAPMQFWV
jgi:acetoin utilization protein AcuB